MRSKLILLTAACLGLLAAPAGAAGKHRRVALLVGVQAYAELEDLYYPEDDVGELSRLLAGGPEPYERVVVMTRKRGFEDPALEPTAAKVKAQLERVTAGLGKDDLVLVAVTGHGFQDRATGDSVFCCQGASLKGKADLLPLQEVYDILGRSRAGLKVVLVDACRGEVRVPGGKGGIPLETVLERDFRPLGTGPKVPRGLVVMHSCSPGERAWESNTFRHGVFFHYVLKALSGEAAGVNDDTVSWLAMAEYVRKGCEGGGPVPEKKIGTPAVVGPDRRQKPHFTTDVTHDIPLIVLDAGLLLLKSDFGRVEAGKFPDGWARDGSVSVQAGDARTVLTATKPGTHRVTTPKVRMTGDFVAEVRFGMYFPQDNLRLTFNGRGTGPSLAVGFKRGGAGLYSSSKAAAVLNGAVARKEFAPWAKGGTGRAVRVERAGDLFTVKIDDETVIAEELSGFKGRAFESLTLELAGNVWLEEKNRFTAKVAIENRYADTAALFVESVEVKPVLATDRP